MMIAVALLLFEGRQRVALFYHPSIYQLSTLGKTKLCHRPTLSSVLSTHHGRHRVAPFYRLSQLSHSRDSDFHSFSSLGFLTPKMTDSREPLQ